MTTGLFAQSQVYVSGYYKSNGTYVAPHYRTAPDSKPYNNYSYPGNYNPNKGTITKGSQSSYLNKYYNNFDIGYTVNSGYTAQNLIVNNLRSMNIGNTDVSFNYKTMQQLYIS